MENINYENINYEKTIIFLILTGIIIRRSTCRLTAKPLANKCPSILAQSVFLKSVSICHSFCGYNTLYGSRHLKRYDVQYRLCASVIRSLCSCFPPDHELVIKTISCDRLPVSYFIISYDNSLLHLCNNISRLSYMSAALYCT